MRNRGITLVALVITIIILLILSGITIQALTGTGLFEKAKQAANESKYANIYPKVEEISYELEVVVDGYKFKISKTGKITGEKSQLATL